MIWRCCKKYRFYILKWRKHIFSCDCIWFPWNRFHEHKRVTSDDSLWLPWPPRALFAAALANVFVIVSLAGWLAGCCYCCLWQQLKLMFDRSKSAKQKDRAPNVQEACPTSWASAQVCCWWSSSGACPSCLSLSPPGSSHRTGKRRHFQLCSI